MRSEARRRTIGRTTTLLFALLAAGPALAAVDIVGQNTARFSWTAASGPVAAYYVYAITHGEPAPGHLIGATAPDQLQIVVSGSYGGSVIVSVAAVDQSGQVGPLSVPSEEIRFTAPQSGGTYSLAEAPVVYVGSVYDGRARAQAYRADGSLAGFVDIDVPVGADPAAYTDLRPVRCDIDGDGVPELLLGFGPGTNGELQLFESELEGFAAITHISIAGGSYNTQNGETYPDCGDFDGDGRDEIVVGRGVGGSGQLELFEDELSGLAPAGSLVVSWLTYNIASGVTRPAAGDFDGDGRDEIVVGMGATSRGFMQIFDDATTGYAHMRTSHGLGFVRIDWPEYQASDGGTYPAAGDIDGDGRDELIVGFDSMGGGAIFVAADALVQPSFPPYPTAGANGLLQLGWDAYNVDDGSTRPVLLDTDGDGRDEILVGLLKAGQGWVRHFDPTPLGDGTVDLPGIAGWLQEKSWALAISGAALAR